MSSGTGRTDGSCDHVPATPTEPERYSPEWFRLWAIEAESLLRQPAPRAWVVCMRDDQGVEWLELPGVGAVRWT